MDVNSCFIDKNNLNGYDDVCILDVCIEKGFWVKEMKLRSKLFNIGIKVILFFIYIVFYKVFLGILIVKGG